MNANRADAARTPGRLDGWRDGIVPATASAALCALTLWIVIGLPQTLELAADATALFLLVPDHAEEHPHPRDIREDQPEPPLAGALPLTRLASRAASHLPASFNDQS